MQPSRSLAQEEERPSSRPSPPSPRAHIKANNDHYTEASSGNCATETPTTTNAPTNQMHDNNANNNHNHLSVGPSSSACACSPYKTTTTNMTGNAQGLKKNNHKKNPKKVGFANDVDADEAVADNDDYASNGDGEGSGEAYSLMNDSSTLHSAQKIDTRNVVEKEKTTPTPTQPPMQSPAQVSHYYACCPPLNDRKDNAVPLYRALLAECLGTAMIVLFGCGAVCSGLSGAYSGIWQTAVVWGLAVTLAILCTAELSGAHLNPAVSLAFWLVRKQAQNMTLTKTFLYVLAQLCGGILGGLLNLLLYDGTLKAFERENDLVRGEANSVLTAAAFGEYFPNPFFNIEYGGDLYLSSDVTVPLALFVEAWGTFCLCAVIFATTHPRNPILDNSCNTRVQVPFCIGMTVSLLLALYAPITQAGWNPARDFGPRIVAWLAGWGSVAIPGPRNGFWIYILGPLIGGPLGAAFMEFIVFGNVLDNQINRIASPRNRQ